MRWSILAHADGIVREDINHGKSHERGKRIGGFM